MSSPTSSTQSTEVPGELQKRLRGIAHLIDQKIAGQPAANDLRALAELLPAVLKREANQERQRIQEALLRGGDGGGLCPAADALLADPRIKLHPESALEVVHRVLTAALDTLDPSGEQGEEKTDWRARAVAHAGALKEVLAAREVVAGTFGETWLREAAETIRLDIGQEPFCAGATALHKDGTLPVPATDPSKEEQSGVELIAVERQRQVSEEGWTPEHDDQHVGCEMALAAMVYADPRPSAAGRDPDSPELWPWERDWFKPRDYPSNLVKAGALIAAEIDRLLRASSKEVGERG